MMTKKRIFSENIRLEELNNWNKGCMIEYIGIEFIEIGPDYLRATMPVDHKTKQTMGALHGGASVTLAETLGSVGSALCIDMNTQRAVGLEINTNHIKMIDKGHVIGITTPIHLGKRTHVWNIEIKNSSDQLISVSRITMAILDK